jgi:hypothetical protein
MAAKDFEFDLDEKMEELAQCVDKEDYKKYKDIIDQCDIDTIASSFWRELFSGGDYEEIRFWMNYSRRQLSIHDIFLINDVDLFKEAMSKENISFDDVHAVIEYLLDDQIYSDNDEELKLVNIKIQMIISDPRITEEQKESIRQVIKDSDAIAQKVATKNNTKKK